jgi:hypothetical protein
VHMPSEPRPLNAEERRVLTFLLAETFPGSDELRLQSLNAIVTRRCDCGCPTVDVETHGPVAPIEGALAAVEADVLPVSDEPPGQILLFLKDGYLSSIEYVYFGAIPDAWPATDRMRLTGLA